MGRLRLQVFSNLEANILVCQNVTLPLKDVTFYQFEHDAPQKSASAGDEFGSVSGWNINNSDLRFEVFL